MTDDYAAIRRLVDHLRAQDVRDQLELVVAAPYRSDLRLPDLPEFARASVVEVESLDPLPAARAAAIRATTAPFVFVAETHTLPRPGWASATIAAHEGGAAVVVPGIGNGNPSDAVSWACLILDYGRWLASGPPREVDVVPGYNTSYRREVLLGLGAGLDELIEQESGLAAELKERAERVSLEPKACVDHLNISRRLHWIRDCFLAGRVLATDRIERWSALKRGVYFAGSPLIPLVLLWRLRKLWPQVREHSQAPLATVPAFVAVSVATAAGEMSGYAVPAGPAELSRMIDNEINRELYLSRGGR